MDYRIEDSFDYGFDIGLGENNIAFKDILSRVQEHISSKYAPALLEANEREKKYKIQSYIDLYLRENKLGVKNLSNNELVDKLYSEMVQFGFLTTYLNDKTVEEININSFDNIVVTYNTGKVKVLEEKFLSEKNAVDIISKILRQSNMTIDASSPSLVGHLSNNIRITANIYPVIDRERGVSASIRIINPQKLKAKDFIEKETLTEEMFRLLTVFQNYGISVIVAGDTGSGKTTLLGAILDRIDDDKRIITIEQDMREFDLIKRDEDGNIINQVINLKTRNRKEGSKAMDIDQEALLKRPLQ